MKSISGKEFARILERHGWELARINGSHHIYRKQGRAERISVPIHGNEPFEARPSPPSVEGCGNLA